MTRGRAAHAHGAPAVLAATVVAGVISCTDGPPAPAAAPLVVHAGIAAGPHNVLSAIVTVSLLNTDSAAVRFGIAGEKLDSVTPVTPLSSDQTTLPVLGLLPATSYRLQVAAYGDGPPTTSDTLSFTTGSLPADLPAYSAGGSDPSPGYVVFGADPYGLVIDNTGRVVWYRHLDGGPTLNFQVQPTGRYTTSPISPVAGDPTPWVEFDPLGNETRKLGCANGLTSRFHDLVSEPDGSYWLMCNETRTMDLTRYGGQPAAVTGTVVQHVDALGTALFTWTPFDHFAITDLDSASRTGATVNWTHGNAIDFDTDGNLLISFRSLSEITKIDLATGAILWRLGGRANQFTISGPPHRSWDSTGCIWSPPISCNCSTTGAKPWGPRPSGTSWTRRDAPPACRPATPQHHQSPPSWVARRRHWPADGFWWLTGTGNGCRNTMPPEMWSGRSTTTRATSSGPSGLLRCTDPGSGRRGREGLRGSMESHATRSGCR